MIKVFTNFSYPTEVEDVVKLFFSDVVACDNQQDADVVCLYEKKSDDITNTCYYNGKKVSNSFKANNMDDLQFWRVAKRFAKTAVYNCLKKSTGRSMPWGSLTGIRPVKLAVQLTEEGKDYKSEFADFFDVKQDKIALVEEILSQQESIRSAGNYTDLYIGIPFCVSRCSYCSFTGGEIARLSKYVEPYVDTLCREITTTLQFAKDHGVQIKNVYFGGGTPTSLDAKDLKRILQCVNIAGIEEFTVEAGRPDTIDKDKLDVMLDCGVNRISVNPQSFNNCTLEKVGRRHTVEDMYDKYNLARSYPFVINADLIAGLPDESVEMFAHSVDSLLTLHPDNITVHTLALKKGAELKLQNYHGQQQIVADMVQYSHDVLHKNGYKAYYMYRQKYMSDNLENVGFCLDGKQCVYNVDNMDELRSIIACGSNAISKRIFYGQNRIERSANAKDVITYINNIDQYLERKLRLFM